MKDYKTLYENAFERAKDFTERQNPPMLDKEIMYQIFPELRDGEDERIRSFIIDFIKACGWAAKKDQGWPSKEECIAWLEKQREQKPIMIQWTGDNLKELVHFTGKSPKFEEWFKTWEDFENYVHTHNNIFKIFNEDGSHVEVPVGAWIIKTPDGYNVASRYVFKKKPADKIEPKFKVGDWITNGEYTWNVADIKPLDYVLQSQNGDVADDTISYVDEEFHLWTIQDAKDGDVLAAHECYVIFKEIDGLNIRCRCTYHYMGLNPSFYVDTLQNKDAFYPATKEQRDLLFQKMHEDGYEWDAEKKELKNIEQASTWGKEDNKIAKELIRYLPYCDDISKDTKERWISWLKSLKPNR